MRLGTVRYTVKQGFRNISRNRMFSIASIATMAACIFLFGIFYSIITNFNHMVRVAEEGVAVVVFFDEGTTNQQKKYIGEQIAKQDGVAEVKYVSGEQAWETFKKQYFEGREELAEGFKENPLASKDNYEVFMESVEDQEDVVKFIEGLKGVERVRQSKIVADTLSKFNVLLTYVSIAIILILLIVAVFLISNTVSMGITIRREEIAIMKYIGAKDAFVRAPFIIEGILIGLIGAAIPLIILYFAYEKAIGAIQTKFTVLRSALNFLEVGEVYATLLPVGLALGVGIGFLGSFLTIRKHLRA